MRKFLLLYLALIMLFASVPVMSAVETNEEPAIRFSSVDQHGNTVTEAILSDKTLVMINYWATWCGPCLNELADLQRLYSENKDNGFLILGVLVDSKPADAASLIAQNGITYPIISISGDLTSLKTSSYIPETIFVDYLGRTLGEPYVGSNSYSDWKFIIKRLMGQAPTPPTTTATPTVKPTATPTVKPTATPTVKPTATPTVKPTATPTVKPTATPTVKPTATPTVKPTATPTVKPTATPTVKPTATPTVKPTATPTVKPTATPTVKPTATPTVKPTATPTVKPTATPTVKPTATPTVKPTATPTVKPTATPTVKPTATPTVKPTATPTVKPTATPTVKPTATPTVKPTATPTVKPTATPTVKPTATPTVKPTATPTVKPTATPTVKPTATPAPVDPVTVEFYVDSTLLHSVTIERGTALTAVPAVPAKELCIGQWEPDDFTNVTANLRVDAVYFKLKLDNEGAYITNIPDGTDVNALLSALGLESAGSTDKLATGTLLTINGKQYSLVVMGDVNCDGSVSAADASCILRALVELETLSMAQRLAAGESEGRPYGANDAALVLRYLVELEKHLALSE